MKIRFLLFFFALYFSVPAFSQSVTYAPGKTVYGNFSANSYDKIDLLIFNNTTDSLDITWTVLSNNLVSGWDYSLCDFKTCYPGIPNFGKMNRMGVADTAFLKINISGMYIEGTGTIDFIVEPNQGENDTIHFIISTYPLSLSENYSNQKFIFSQNPASGFVSVQLNNNKNSTIIFTNILGEVVKQENIFKEKNIVQISELPEGIYFASLYNNGQFIETKKIIVSH